MCIASEHGRFSFLFLVFSKKTNIGREFNLPPPEERQWPSLFSLIITPEEELRNQRRQLIVLANNRNNLVFFYTVKIILQPRSPGRHVTQFKIPMNTMEAVMTIVLCSN